MEHAYLVFYPSVLRGGRTSVETYNACRLDIPAYHSSFSAIISKFNEGNTDQHVRMLTQCVFELVMDTDGLWFLSDVHFTRSDVYGPITFLSILIEYVCDIII